MGFGEVRGPSDVCLDNLGPGVGHQVGVFSCHGKGQNQVSSICHFSESFGNVGLHFEICTLMLRIRLLHFYEYSQKFKLLRYQF